MFGAFCFDVSNLVKFDAPNVIAVRVNNARDTTIAPLRADFTMFGGLYRGVHLLILDRLSISPLDDASPGVYAKQVSVSPKEATLEITTVLRNANPEGKGASLRCTIFDDRGKQVRVVQSEFRVPRDSSISVRQPLSILSPRLWNGRKDPYLYRLRVELIEGMVVRDRVVQSLGLRFFRIDPEKGFFLNGESYPLHGVNRHQDREGKGWAIGIKEHTEDFRLIEDLGCTAVRLAHYQHAQEFYDLCDRGGMVVWAELALVDEIHPCSGFAEGCRQQLTELIKQNYNHPSIVMWSMFNELMPESDRDMYGRTIADLNALSKRLDPTRLTTEATRGNYSMTESINSVTDVIGYNLYKGWYESAPEDLGPFLDTLHARNPSRALCVSEYGAGAGITQHEIPPSKPRTDGPWHPQEWQSQLHEISWNALAARPFVWGVFIWNMFDFGVDSRKEGEHPGRNDKGLVTYDRKVKKDAFFWYRANWNPAPMVHIASKHFVNRRVGETEIKVYANCEDVSLSVNGVALGHGVASGRCYAWKGVLLKEGSNAVVARGTKGGRGFDDSCVWEVTR
jgi:beta-galactosidase